jgi:mono/diheme cytochrome c family protein
MYLSKYTLPQQYVEMDRIFLLTVLLSLGLLLASCGGGSSTGPEPPPEDDPPPGENRPVSYSDDIQPIFSGNCATSGCHDSSTQQNGVNLSSYDAVMNSEGLQYGRAIVDPGNPENSPIVDKIEPNPEFGVRMPENADPLSDAEIDSIRAWIEDGAENN